MNKIDEFFEKLSGKELPAVKVAIDTNTLVNLFLTIAVSGAVLMLMYSFIFHNKNKNN